MKKILVTGSNGQLGRALHQLLQNSDADVTYTTSKDLDIRDEKAVHAFVQTCNPDLIINAAAHTAVDLCESDKENAYAINANGPKYLAMAAKEIDAELVHVSTDMSLTAHLPDHISKPIHHARKASMEVPSLPVKRTLWKVWRNITSYVQHGFMAMAKTLSAQCFVWQKIMTC